VGCLYNTALVMLAMNLEFRLRKNSGIQVVTKLG
jgi:hypothetical protein